MFPLINHPACTGEPSVAFTRRSCEAVCMAKRYGSLDFIAPKTTATIPLTKSTINSNTPRTAVTIIHTTWFLAREPGGARGAGDKTDGGGGGGGSESMRPFY